MLGWPPAQSSWRKSPVPSERPLEAAFPSPQLMPNTAFPCVAIWPLWATAWAAFTFRPLSTDPAALYCLIVSQVVSCGENAFVEGAVWRRDGSVFPWRWGMTGPVTVVSLGFSPGCVGNGVPWVHSSCHREHARNLCSLVTQMKAQSNERRPFSVSFLVPLSPLVTLTRMRS